ncbi:MAG: acyltransferase family protein, partial [Gemmatimonadaceae bacterium]
MTTLPVAEDARLAVPVYAAGEFASPPTRAAARPSRIHLPALDGVRTIAIAMVIVYHSVNGLPGMTRGQNLFLRLTGQGWMGVDLFFVLSGFLITGILFDVRSERHALRNFYARRVLRIAPVYVVFLLFSLWMASAIGTSSAEETAQLQHTQLWYWTYSVNILVALHDWSATTFPMGHLWSLAVEEQFYLLWPIAVLVLSPVTLRRTALGCIVAAEVCRLLFILGGAGGQVNYVLLPARMDLLAAGAFLALAYRESELWSRVLRARKYAVLFALVLVLATVLSRQKVDFLASFEQLVLFPAIVALAGVVVSSAAVGIAWLSGGAMRFVGKISYGMYVWHLVAMRLILTVVQVPSTTSPASWWIFYTVMMAGTFFGAIVLALISWYVIEQPFLRLKRFVPYEYAGERLN